MTDTVFETHRSFLVSLAYRMLGSVAEAEDVVQDAFVRWSEVEQAAVEHPRAYLARVVSRLCLDRMKSATARREQYVGMWLPEPVVAGPAESLSDDLSVALLLTLERLSPLERAAFLLHDVFDLDYSAIADTLGRSEAATRQLAARAREHVRDEKPRFEASAETRQRLTDAFHTAMTSGDIDAIAKLLADDCTFYSDGGGKRLAALNPIHGRDKIIRFLVGIATKFGVPDPASFQRTQLNGLPGFVSRTAEGIETLALEIAGDQIVAIYSVRNPDKVQHLA
jgi:RNA polymerase sigma-70 factor (ECF subfamily)